MPVAFVTGATGFLGSHVARELAEQGYTLRISHRKSSRLDALKGLEYEAFIGDLDMPEILVNALQGVDVVFHVAAVSAYWRNNKETLFRVNIDGTRCLLEQSLKAGVQRFIFTSSAAAVGYDPDGHAVDETHQFNFDPKVSPYGLSKALAEAEVHRAIEQGLDAVILNPAVIIGPGDLNKISGSLVIETAKGRQPFMPMQGGVTIIDVRDVAKAHVAAIEKGRCGERYLLGAVNTSHRALFKLVAKVARVRPPLLPAPGFVVSGAAFLADVASELRISLPGDVEGNQLRLSKLDLYFNCEKSWRELHQPEVDLVQSIQDTYDWYRQNGDI